MGIVPTCSPAVGTGATSQAQRSAALQNIFFMGDFNADCSYVTAEQWPSIRLRSLSSCEWLIPDSADTTVTSTDCAYDRWVAQQRVWGLPWGEQQVLTPGTVLAASLPVALRCARRLSMALLRSTISRRLCISRTRM